MVVVAAICVNYEYFLLVHSRLWHAVTFVNKKDSLFVIVVFCWSHSTKTLSIFYIFQLDR